jgi:outer membrane murein-binding lipoprotein Lpp
MQQNRGFTHFECVRSLKIKKYDKMKKQLMLAGIATTALIFAGCGGDKKVEERVAQIQTNAVVVDTNSAVVTTLAPKTESCEATDTKRA